MCFIYRAFSVFLLIFLGTAYASADNVLTINGLLHPAYADLNGGFAAIPPPSGTGGFSWTATYINYSGTQQCGSYVCRTDYSANFDGGVVTGTYTIQNQTYLLQAHIVSGTIRGYFCVPDYIRPSLCPPGGNGAQADFQFVGAWNNGWLATGDIFATGNEFWSVGSYTINTQIANSPEPATFLLLGSSVLILTGVVRRRLRM